MVKLKNKYYFIGEEFFNKKKIENNVEIDYYENYYELYDILEIKQNIRSLLDKIKNIILYINPDVLLFPLRKGKIYKDFNYYEIQDINITQINQYYYELNIFPFFENGLIFPFTNIDIISFFKINNGLNFIILEIELFYNYIILLNYNENYIKILKENSKNFFKLV